MNFGASFTSTLVIAWIVELTVEIEVWKTNVGRRQTKFEFEIFFRTLKI